MRAVSKSINIVSLFILINFLSLSTPAQANQNLERILLQLSSVERTALTDDQVSLTGEEGQYKGRFLVKASVSQAWDVLTDYSNFPKYLPNVVSVEVLETNENKTIFEQIQSTKVLFFNQETRLRIAVTKTEFSKINFNLIEGGLKSLEGSWEIVPVTVGDEVNPSYVLITHTVKVEPDSNVPVNLFYSIYRDSLKQSLEATKAEIEKRTSLVSYPLR